MAFYSKAVAYKSHDGHERVLINVVEYASNTHQWALKISQTIPKV